MDVTKRAAGWNLDKASLWVEGLHSDIDLAVLPEGFDGGGDNAGTIGQMREVAEGCGKAVCFTTEYENHNRFCFIHPNGSIEAYDKRHLYKNEGHLLRGCKRVFIEYKGMKILPEVCYDLRFPVWSRNPGTEPYDIAIYAAAWPEDRISVWDILLRARAIENLCYVIGANRVGYRYPGHSVAVDYTGKVMAKADDDLECSFTAELDKVKIDEFRRNFCNFGDQDTFRL